MNSPFLFPGANDSTLQALYCWTASFVAHVFLPQDAGQPPKLPEEGPSDLVPLASAPLAWRSCPPMATASFQLEVTGGALAGVGRVFSVFTFNWQVGGEAPSLLGPGAEAQASSCLSVTWFLPGGPRPCPLPAPGAVLHGTPRLGPSVLGCAPSVHLWTCG